MTKSLTIFVLLATLVLFTSSGASARRLRTNPNRGKFTTAASVVEEATPDSSSPSDRVSVETLDKKFSFPDPAADKFKSPSSPLESDRKSFGVSSGVNSPFSDAGTSISSFGKGLRKRKPSYQISEESEEDANNSQDGPSSYEVNYKTAVTHKPGPNFDSGSFKFASVTHPPLTKTKFGSSHKFSSFNSQHGSGAASPTSGLFKFNEPSSNSGLSNGQITTKFAVSHPVPTHSASNLGGSYQTYSEENSASQSTEKFISDYHKTLAKQQKTEKPKFQFSTPSFKKNFGGSDSTSNFKVSSDLKVGSESHQPQYQKTKFGGGSEFGSFKPQFKLQEVPNLYPTEEHFGPSGNEDQFRPSLGYSGISESTNSGSKLFEPSSEGEDFLAQQLAKNPASKGQYQQFLKSQEDEKIEQQALLEQLKYQQSRPKAVPKPSRPAPQPFPGSSTKFRPYITVKKSFNRRKPLVRVSSSPGLSHYRTPVIDGPYTIHFSV